MDWKLFFQWPEKQKKRKPEIIEIIEKTPGKMHSWVRARGKEGEIIIKKENKYL